MANVTVEASSNIEIGNRVSVRTTGDFVYVLATSGTSLEMHKGNVAGEPASFDTPVAITGITGLVDEGGACAIDSADIIHCMYYILDGGAMGKTHELKYVTFDTSTDTFGSIIIPIRQAVLGEAELQFQVTHQILYLVLT